MVFGNKGIDCMNDRWNDSNLDSNETLRDVTSGKLYALPSTLYIEVEF